MLLLALISLLCGCPLQDRLFSDLTVNGWAGIKSFGVTPVQWASLSPQEGNLTSPLKDFKALSCKSKVTAIGIGVHPFAQCLRVRNVTCI